MLKALLFKLVNQQIFCFIILILLVGHSARATHIVGGELDLQHQTGSTYRLTLNLYFDDVNGSPGALDPDLTVGIFEKGSNRVLQNVVLPLSTNTFVAYTNPACEAPTLRTRRLVYTRLIELPAGTYTNAAGYYAAVERCCRNNTISNIDQPENAGQTFYLEFPPVVRNGQPLINSTPRIFPPLSDYACINELFYYNFGGEDTDGDSLVYEMVTPLNGSSSPAEPKPLTPASAPYDLVRWKPGLSTNNQIPGSPALAINRRTGRLTVRPAQLGLFVFSIKCSEYRKGVKLGEVRRDFQLKVLNCPPNQTPDLTLRLPGQTQNYVPGRDILRLEPGADRCLRLRFTDPDPASQLTLSINPVNFRGLLPTFTVQQGVVRTPGRPDTLVSQLCFPECMDTKGQVYLLDVIVADNGCSLPRRDTVQVAFIAVPPPNSPPVITTTAPHPLRAGPGELVSFDIVVTDPDQDPLTLEMLGRGFGAAALGAQLTQTRVGNELRGRFSWRVPCQTADKTLYEFEFNGSAAPCNNPQSTKLVVPIEINSHNLPPSLTTTANAARPLLVRPGQLLTFDLLAADPENDPLTLTLQGRGFTPAAVDAQLKQNTRNNQLQGRFEWVVPCPIGDKLLYEFEFTAASTACGAQQATSLTIPIQIDTRNTPPTFTSNMFAAPGAEPLIIRRLPGEAFEAKVLGLDPDNNPLNLKAVGAGFELGAAGMSFAPSADFGKVEGTFRWTPSCRQLLQQGVREVTFELQEINCGSQVQRRTVRFETVSLEEVEFKPPTIFTPNGDSKNDFFEIINLPPDFCDVRFAGITVFNRWGASVFRSSSRAFRWDGSGLPAGMYYYLIEYTDKRQIKGHITIAR
ncbi:gliding motility-associated C-terminal domain-containing protein [Hymenobacter sp. HD11105]